MLNINVRTIRLLSLMEHAPKYGRQLAKLAPEVFLADDFVQVTGKPIKVAASNIYVILSRVEKAGLIEKLESYKPPASLDIPQRSKDRVVWYGITSKGRQALREARVALKMVDR